MTQLLRLFSVRLGLTSPNFLYPLKGQVSVWDKHSGVGIPENSIYFRVEELIKNVYSWEIGEVRLTLQGMCLRGASSNA